MRPTEILVEEHRVIERMLTCLEIMAEKAEEEGELGQRQARDAVTFFREFADRCHHGKEETHLFPMMEACGFPPHAGPTAVMRSEHEEGRAHVRGMAAAAEALGKDPKAVADFVSHARSYVTLLHEHIAKENECLFPMADDALGPDKQSELMALFEKVESQEGAKETREKCLEIAGAMAERFGIDPAGSPAHAGRPEGACVK